MKKIKYLGNINSKEYSNELQEYKDAFENKIIDKETYDEAIADLKKRYTSTSAPSPKPKKKVGTKKTTPKSSDACDDKDAEIAKLKKQLSETEKNQGSNRKPKPKGEISEKAKKLKSKGFIKNSNSTNSAEAEAKTDFGADAVKNAKADKIETQADAPIQQPAGKKRYTAEERKVIKAQKAEQKAQAKKDKIQAKKEAKAKIEKEKEQVQEQARLNKVSLLNANYMYAHKTLYSYCKLFASKIGKTPKEIWVISFMARMSLDNSLGKYKSANSPLYKIMYDSLNNFQPSNQTIGDNISKENLEKIKEIAKYATPPTFSIIKSYVRIVKNGDTAEAPKLLARIQRLQDKKVIQKGIKRYDEVLKIKKNLENNTFVLRDTLRGLDKETACISGMLSGLSGLSGFEAYRKK